MSNGEELANCPFCGQQPRLSEDYEHSTAWIVECIGDIDQSCPAAPGVWGASRSEAITRWNRRSSPSAVEAAEVVAYVPTILRMGEEYGDPHWQFVLKDAPTITHEPYAANVENLTDFHGNLIGFNIYSLGGGARILAPASQSEDGVTPSMAAEWMENLDRTRTADTALIASILSDASPPPASPSAPQGVDPVAALLDAYDAETKLLPLGHEMPTRGASTYNWRRSIVDELRILSAIQTSPEAGR